MMAAGHQHHTVQAGDLEVLDALTRTPLVRSRPNGEGQAMLTNGLAGHGLVKRPLDTLQALRRPPIDPIVLAASLSSGPHVTRHHFLHSFGPKRESKQMTRSERIRKLQEQEAQQAREEEKERQRRMEQSSPSTSRQALRTRSRAGSYANCDADDEALADVRRAAAFTQSIIEEEAAATAELPSYQSKQMPRSERLRLEREAKEKRERAEAQKPAPEAPPQTASNAAIANIKEASRPPINRIASQQLDDELLQRKQMIEVQQRQAQQQMAIGPGSAGQPMPMSEGMTTTASFSSIVRPPPLAVRCYARTRIPTPHGEIFCHLYRNNRDQKEHLALVVDPAQNAPDDRYAAAPGPLIRSRTLDEVWGPTETEMERIVRGAYVGRLGPTYQEASKPKAIEAQPTASMEPPLVRIHSECYTGETIGSQRCDCGEQLDEAIRLIHADARPAKGVVVYLRQEGRGIGLLDKLMAYNLQDMGHDTVAANILLGHLADARKYDVAAEILRDLGVGSCRLLTNNPDKMEALEAEGIRVAKRVAMVPRIWRIEGSRRRTHRHRRLRTTSGRAKGRKGGHPMHASIISQFEHDSPLATAPVTDDDGGAEDDEYGSYDEDEGTLSDDSRDSYLEHHQRRAGATLVGGSVTRGPELEKYLRTKVERMGHLLDLPSTDESMGSHAAPATSSSPAPAVHAYDAALQADRPGKLDGSDADTAGTDDEPLLNTDELREIIGAHSNGEEADDEILIHHRSSA